MGGVTISTREGLLFALGDVEGNVGYGEASPLPGFHLESLQEIKQQVDQHRDVLANRLVEEDLDPLGLLPSLHYGLEGALCNLRARQANTSLDNWLNPHARTTVSLNTLITDNEFCIR